MEEVDNIIIHTLKEIGCEINEEVLTLREFSVEMVVHSVSKCLSTINDQLNVQSVLPESMSARFRVGSTLASSCKELGYQGEMGYQTFLYANEHNLRNVLMFLIEKLPKESAENSNETIGTSALLGRRIAAELKRQLSMPWSPAYCKQKNVVNKDGDWFFQGSSSFHRFKTQILEYPFGLSDVNKKREAENIPFIFSQVSDLKDLHSSVAEENRFHLAEDQEWETEWNQGGIASRLSIEEYKKQKRDRLMKRIKEKLSSDATLAATKSATTASAFKDFVESRSGKDAKKTVKGSRFTHTEKLQFAEDPEKIEAKIKVEQEVSKEEEESEEEKQKKHDTEIESLRNELNELSLKAQNCQAEIKQMVTQKEKVDEKATDSETLTKELEDAYRVKKRTFDLLPDADSNIEKLVQLVENSNTKLINLNEQWEKHRIPLANKYEELKNQNTLKTSQVETFAEQIRSLREKMKTATDEIKSKEELHKQLIAEYESMSKDVNRSAYTRRILEIVGNIKKQKDQIATVLTDTKELQKDINFLTGKLERQYIVTDELVFKDAKKDEFSKKAYKLLAGLHESFSTLVETIEDTGLIMREIRDLEEQLDKIIEVEIDANLERIGEDLRAIKQENNAMIASIKNKNN